MVGPCCAFLQIHKLKGNPELDVLADQNTNAMASRKLCLLSLDGGGIRGLSELFVLKELMTMINPSSPPEPYECFDMIGGTSTGG